MFFRKRSACMTGGVGTSLAGSPQSTHCPMLRNRFCRLADVTRPFDGEQEFGDLRSLSAFALVGSGRA